MPGYNLNKKQFPMWKITGLQSKQIPDCKVNKYQIAMWTNTGLQCKQWKVKLGD